MNAVYQIASAYQGDALSLPVKNLNESLPFYTAVMGFQILSHQDEPVHSAVLSRDTIQIGLAENGGDPSQEGCFFEVNSVEAAFEQLKANGLTQEEAGYRLDQYGDTRYRVFFVIAPDGLCYCLGEQQA